MKHDIKTLFFRHTRLLILCLLLIVIAGLSAFYALPKLEDPLITNRFATIVTHFSGASAKRVESQVTEKIEDELQELPEIKELSSSSRQGVSVIFVELHDHVNNVAAAWSRTRDRLAKVSAKLPKGAREPTLDEERTYSFTRLIAIQSESKAVSFYLLNRYAKKLKRRLQRLPGTGLARVYGAPKEEITIAVRPKALQALDLSLKQLSDIIKQADAKLPAGHIYQKKRQILLELAGEFLSIKRIQEIPIATDEGGSLVRLESVARVYHDYRRPAEDLARVNNKRAVVVAVRIKSNQKIGRWDGQVNKVLSEFKSQLPAQLTVQTVFNQHGYTANRLNGLRDSLLFGVLLVFVVLLVTLGWRASIIVTSTLPLTLLLTFVVLDSIGVPIQQMTIIGMIASLGLVVDNAIVMVSSMRRLLMMGKTPIVAVRAVIQHHWVPLLSATFTTIFAFLPIVFLTGPTGEFVFGIAASVIAALICSYLLSITIVPAISGRWLAKTLHEGSRFSWLETGVKYRCLSRYFKGLICLSLCHPKKTVFATMLISLLGFLSLLSLTNQFFPRADRNQFYIELYLPEQSSITHTLDVVGRAYTKIMKNSNVSHVTWFVGRNAPSFYYNLLTNNDGLPNYSQAIVDTRNSQSVPETIKALQRQLDRDFPQAQFLVRPLTQGPHYSAPIEIRLYGPQLEVLMQLGNQFRLLLSEVEGVTHTRASLTLGVPKVVIKVDEDKLRQMNVSLTDIASDLRDKLDGVPSGSLTQETEEIPLRVQFDDSYRKTMGAFTEHYFNSKKQSKHELGIPLTSYAVMKLRPSIGNISHRDGERLNIVSAYIQPTVLPQTVLDQFKMRLQQAHVQLPRGYYFKYGGEQDKRETAVASLFSKIGFILVLMLTTLILTFNSFRLMVVVLFVGVQAVGMGLFSLFIFGFPFGFNAVIALMGLVGVAINASIIIISNLQLNQRAKRGNPLAISSVLLNKSSRHIVSTTLTTVFGFIPLALTSSTLWPPFAIVFIGGMILTTLVSFFFVPSCYLLTRRAHDRFVKTK